MSVSRFVELATSRYASRGRSWRSERSSRCASALLMLWGGRASQRLGRRPRPRQLARLPQCRAILALEPRPKLGPAGRCPAVGRGGPLDNRQVGGVGTGMTSHRRERRRRAGQADVAGFFPATRGQRLLDPERALIFRVGAPPTPSQQETDATMDRKDLRWLSMPTMASTPQASNTRRSGAAVIGGQPDGSTSPRRPPWRVSGARSRKLIPVPWPSDCV